MNIPNSATDTSNNNQHFQSFLQGYLSNLIQNPSPTEQTFTHSPLSSNYYINPIYNRRRRIQPNNMVHHLKRIF